MFAGLAVWTCNGWLVHAENPPMQCLPRLGLAKAALRVGKRVYIRRCLGDSYNYGMGSNNDFGIGGPKVRFGSLADILTSPRHGPLFPPKQTFVSASRASVTCHKPTFLTAGVPRAA